MKKSLAIILLFSLIIVGCKKTDEPKTDDNLISNENIRVSGIIKFPTGMNQNASGYSVNSFLSEQTLTNNEYSVEVIKNDYNIQFLANVSDKDIMLGFTYPNQTDFTIDANSTILALTMKLPSVNSLSNTGKQNFITKLKNSSKYPNALIAVENHIRAGKDIFDTTDVIMQQKISELFDQAASRSGFGTSGQVYINKVDKTITIGNPGVSFSQVIGIYDNNVRIKKLELDHYKFYATSIFEIINTVGTTPNPIEQSYTFSQDGIYKIKVRNGGFNPINNDIESKEAIIINGTNIVMDNLEVFIPFDSRECIGKIFAAVKTKVELTQSAMSASTDKTAFLKIIYNITIGVCDELALVRYCTAIKPGGYTYIRKITKYIKWLDKIGVVGTFLNNTIFALEYFSDSRSSLDTTIVIGNPLLGKWKITGYVYGDGTNYYNTTMPQCDKDNLITYSVNNKVSIDEGATKCYLANPQIVTETYILNNNGINIYTYAGDEGDDLDDFEIILLNATTLKLKEPFNNSVITYTRQP